VTVTKYAAPGLRLCASEEQKLSSKLDTMMIVE